MRSLRRGHYTGLLGALVVLALLIHALLISPADPNGIAPGNRLAPFAAPLAQGSLTGDADIATHADDGEAGRVAACAERGPQILNICQLYEQGPVVLALFVDSPSCTVVLSHMQALVAHYPGVRFAAVAVRAQHSSLRELIRRLGISFPVGIDADGAVAATYRQYTCPQVNFADRGGVIASPALLGNAPAQKLRARVAALAASARRREGPARERT